MFKNANFHRIIKVNNLPEIVYRKTMAHGVFRTDAILGKGLRMSNEFP